MLSAALDMMKSIFMGCLWNTGALRYMQLYPSQVRQSFSMGLYHKRSAGINVAKELNVVRCPFELCSHDIIVTNRFRVSREFHRLEDGLHKSPCSSIYLIGDGRTHKMILPRKNSTRNPLHDYTPETAAICLF